jgi:ATP-dependent 26S proteasome regulatory subunit
MIRASLVVVILSLIPVTIVTSENKVHLGILLSELLAASSLLYLSKFLKICTRKEVYVPESYNDNTNHIFYKLQDYITNKFAKEISSYEIVPKNGEVGFNILEIIGQKFHDSFTDINGDSHDIELSIEQKSVSLSVGVSTEKKAIIMRSKTASPDIIKKYVTKITAIEHVHNNSVRVFKPLIRGKKKDEKEVDWQLITTKVNKDLVNTAYSSQVVKDLFDDVAKFIGGEAFYNKRGIPYKRGYLLHGPPGTGKTSVPKILARLYNLPIFCVDLTTIKINSDLTRLLTELNNYTNFGKYILLMEDADRSDFFDPDYVYRRDDKLSMDCLLNEIDGVCEPNGRLLIITSNEPDVIMENKALMRPGRIDKSIELGYCLLEQVKQLYNLFYDDLLASGKAVVNWDNYTLHDRLSPAFVTKVIQEHIGEPDRFLSIIADSTVEQKFSLDDTFTKQENFSDDDYDGYGHGGRNNSRGRSRSRIRSNARRKQDPISKTKQHIRQFTNAAKHCDKSATALSNRKTKLTNDILPALRTKLAKLLEKKADKERKTKAKKLAAKMKEAGKEVGNCEDELEHDTPAFLLNSIESDEVPKDVIVSYAALDDEGEEEDKTDDGQLDKEINELTEQIKTERKERAERQSNGKVSTDKRLTKKELEAELNSEKEDSQSEEDN